MILSPEVRAFLDETRFGVLATVNPDGSVHQSVMWYVLDGDQILMNTARGRIKAANLGANQTISLCIEDGYRFVTISGRATLDEDQDRAHADIRRIGSRYVDYSEIDDMYERNFKGQFRISIVMPISSVIAHGF